MDFYWQPISVLIVIVIQHMDSDCLQSVGFLVVVSSNWRCDSWLIIDNTHKCARLGA